jgi:hypothetical protein
MTHHIYFLKYIYSRRFNGWNISSSQKIKNFWNILSNECCDTYIWQVDLLMARSANCNSSQVRMWIICKELPQGRTETSQWKFITQNIYRPIFECWKSLWESRHHKHVLHTLLLTYLHYNSQCTIFAYPAATWNDTLRVVHLFCILCCYLQWD